MSNRWEGEEPSSLASSSTRPQRGEGRFCNVHPHSLVQTFLGSTKLCAAKGENGRMRFLLRSLHPCPSRCPSQTFASAASLVHSTNFIEAAVQTGFEGTHHSHMASRSQWSSVSCISDWEWGFWRHHIQSQPDCLCHDDALRSMGIIEALRRHACIEQIRAHLKSRTGTMRSPSAKRLPEKLQGPKLL